jgi:hypothetical protein
MNLTDAQVITAVANKNVQVNRSQVGGREHGGDGGAIRSRR